MNILLRVCYGLVVVLRVHADAQKRPPNYSQDRMPVTSFSCRDKILGGYYADPETDCQMFHVCVKVPGLGIQDYKFLCPNDTSFDQENQICDDWYNIDCEVSTLYYSDNFDLYRIGSDSARNSNGPKLPNININNAVSDNDDDLYIQKGGRGENSGSDLLRGSHSSNFYSNKNRGREDDDEPREDQKKKNTNVRKLLTGKRPVATTQAPVSESSPNSYQPRYQNRISQFRGHVRNQPSTEVTASPSTETYNNHNRQQNYNQRNYFSTTTPKTETTHTVLSTDFFRNYNPTTKRNFYQNTQNYNSQPTYNFSPTTTVSPANFYETTLSTEKKINYETQKLYKLNTGAADPYEDPKEDEFLKTAHSQNLGASAFNRVQNAYKGFNTSVGSSFGFSGVKTSTEANQANTFFNPTTLHNHYSPSTTVKPYQPQNYYTTQTPLSTQNFNGPQYSSTNYSNFQNYYSPSTQKPFQQQYTQQTFQQYTTKAPFPQQYNQITQQNHQSQPSTIQRNTQTTQISYQPSQRTQTPAPYQQPPRTQTPAPYQQPQRTQTPTPYQQPPQRTQTPTPYQQPQRTQTPTPYQQPPQRTQTPTPYQQPPQRTQTPTPYQQPQRTQTTQTYQQYNKGSSYQQPPQRGPTTQPPYQQSQHNPSTQQQHNWYNSPTTQKPFQPNQIKTTSPVQKGQPVTDATEKPRPFAQGINYKNDKKEKEQYDYAYYDEGTQSEYDNLETVEEFRRTN